MRPVLPILLTGDDVNVLRDTSGFLLRWSLRYPFDTVALRLDDEKPYYIAGVHAGDLLELRERSLVLLGEDDVQPVISHCFHFQQGGRIQIFLAQSWLAT